MDSSCAQQRPCAHKSASVLANDQLAEQTWRLRLHCPEVAALAQPGQFFMVRIAGRTDPLLGRPFALYDTVLDGQGGLVGLEIVHLVVGKMTTLLSGLKPGDSVEIWGPLGMRFPAVPDHVARVALARPRFLPIAESFWADGDLLAKARKK